MKDNKLEIISNLFDGIEIRRIWNEKEEEYYFSVVDVVAALTDSAVPKRYWSDLKRNLVKEGSEVYEKIVRFKILAKDGKMRNTDMLNTQNILRLIESVPSPKAEPFKMWLASLGKERIDEVFDPEKAAKRVVEYYRVKGYDDVWIKQRLISIVDRFKLTDVWKENGIDKPLEFALLTNEIYRAWSGMTASEYKAYKGIRKESLRDNMTDIEVALTNLGEVTTRELAKKKRPHGLKENMQVAKSGGEIAYNTRKDIEQKLGETVLSKDNVLKYKYINENKQIKD